jgi:hypothetical protein
MNLTSNIWEHPLKHNTTVIKDNFYTVAPETPDGFLNLKTSLPANWCFSTDSHHAQ